jgi:hypothetical protein
VDGGSREDARHPGEIRLEDRRHQEVQDREPNASPQRRAEALDLEAVALRLEGIVTGATGS